MGRHNKKIEGRRTFFGFRKPNRNRAFSTSDRGFSGPNSQTEARVVSKLSAVSFRFCVIWRLEAAPYSRDPARYLLRIPVALGRSKDDETLRVMETVLRTAPDKRASADTGRSTLVARSPSVAT